MTPVDPNALPDDPDAVADADEARAAARLGELLAGADDGRVPAALGADERDLVELAIEIRAGAGTSLALPPARAAALVDAALRAAVGAGAPAAAEVTAMAPRRRGRWLPAATVALAAAAVLAIVVGNRAAPRQGETATARTAAPAPLPEAWRSRSADALIGRIEPARAGDAAARIDVIFADRLSGFRERRLAGGGAP